MTSRSSPALAPMMPSSKPGMKLPWPSTMCASSAVPPSNASPSILPTKSTVTRSPFAGRAASSGVKRDAALDQLTHGLVDGLGVDVGHEPLELQALEVGELDSGSTSNVIE